MDILALTELDTPIDALASLLATELQITAYEARQRLAPGVPCVLDVTADRARTLSLLATLRSRGHGALACDQAAVTPSSAMTAMRRFRFEEGALVPDAGEGEGSAAARETHVRYADVVALVRANHRHEVETREETKEKKFRPAAAIATGGLILTKTVKREVVRTAEEKDAVLYVFRRGGPPLLLRESGASYAGLGEAIQPTRMANFATTVRVLRTRAPSAPYDERLLSVKKFPAPPNVQGAPRTFDAETGGVDLLAHILAMWLSRTA